MMGQVNTIFKPMLVIIGITIIAAFKQPIPLPDSGYTQSEPIDTLKQNALEILQTKCNVCHRKQNPFKVFSEKNMEKHAAKIQKQVFVKRRMPKGDIKLTATEYSKLEKWLSTQNIK